MPIIFQSLYGSVRVDLPLTATNAATGTSVFIQQERAACSRQFALTRNSSLEIGLDKARTGVDVPPSLKLRRGR
jgi:hypothetical protein